MDDWEKEANELHIKLCGECCHDVTFETKLRKALRDARKRTIEDCAKVAEAHTSPVHMAHGFGEPWSYCSVVIAEAIRGLGK